MSTTGIKLCRLCSFFIVLNNNFELNMGNKKFYKFRECDDRYFESLRKGTIYFSSLQALNDPFEGKFSLGETRICNATTKLQDKMNRRLVFSMSEGFDDGNFIRDNHLMWTHYAKEYKGFCIEYNDNILSGFKDYELVRNIQENIWVRMHYNESMVDDILMEDDLERSVANILRNKNIAFKYENEVRLIRHTLDLNDKLKDVSDAVSAIYLGCRISCEDKMKLLSICYELGVKCFQMSLEKSSYTLRCDEILFDKFELREVDPITCRLING